MKNKGRKTAK